MRSALSQLALAFLALTCGAGLWSSLAPGLNSAAWSALWSWPGLWPSLRATLISGLGSTALAAGLAVLILALWPAHRLLQLALAPALALPHLAAALGAALLLSPSGWLVRLLAPLTGQTAPPETAILNDPLGLALMLGLVAKELPFLLLMALAALPACQPQARMVLAQSLGRGQVMAFLTAVLPALYPALRLPLLAVLAYGIGNVDMALVLGPTRPPTLAVQVAEWLQRPAYAAPGQAEAAIALILGLSAALLLACLLAERLAARFGRALAARGRHGHALDPLTKGLVLPIGIGLLAGLGLSLGLLGLWSLAGPWDFPAPWPESLQLTTWSAAGRVLPDLGGQTLALAAMACLAALILALSILSCPAPPPLLLIYLPLILPQIAFLPGLSRLLLPLGLDQGFWPVLLGHLVFVLPYVLLTLAGPWSRLDPRYEMIAASLGATPRRQFLALRLPLLTVPILSALAVGLAVSIGQYLPTLLLGGGRVSTLTTEALALSSGSNRRLTAALGLVQALLPMLAFAAALALPRLIFARRRAMLETR